MEHDPGFQPEHSGGMMSEDRWNTSVECCGNCAFWPLGGYQSSYSGAQPLGCGGNQGDGSVSECRRHAPVSVNQDRHPGRTAVWPQVGVRDFCGDFELR